MLKKICIGIVVFLLVLLIVLAVGRNMIVKAAVTTGVKVVTGLNMQVESINIGLMNTLLGINGLVLYNPADFEDKIMMDLPEIYVDYDLGALMKKKVHLSEVRLDLKEFVVVKNKQGVLNLDSLTAVQTAKKTEPAKKDQPKAVTGEKLQIQIDLMKLKIGKVIYKDYSKGGEPVIKEFKINVDEQYENITDPEAVVRIIVVKALANTTLSSLTNFKLGPLTDSLQGSVKDAGKLVGNIAGDALGLGKNVGGTATETVKTTTEKLKNLLPFGK
ncbi:MAG: AsmA family protein [Candidatus Omnitrophica bacterium]|nr:AsmA family protein [Candidatus Omnitrophota bacterium]